MSVDYGLGKGSNNLTFGGATNSVSLSINAAHTTDGGLAFGGGFTMGTAATLSFSPYVSSPSGAPKHYLAKKTNNDRADILGHAYNVSGGAGIDVADVVSVKINSNWYGIDSEASKYIIDMGSSFTSSAICKVAGKGGIAANAAWAGNTSLLGNAGDWNAAGNGSYLPAGQLIDTVNVVVNNTTNPNAAVGAAGANAAGNGAAAGSVNTTHGASARITKNATIKAGVYSIAKSNANDTIYGWQGEGEVDFNGAVGTDAADVTSAAIYIGPFMEVMMASSSTKMVYPDVCCMDWLLGQGSVFRIYFVVVSHYSFHMDSLLLSSCDSI
jgi:hypothetical protein